MDLLNIVETKLNHIDKLNGTKIETILFHDIKILFIKKVGKYLII